MIFIWGKASHTARKYINKSAYWQYRKTLLVVLPPEQFAHVDGFSLKLLHSGL